MLGWLLDVPALTRLLPLLPVMQPNTALSIVACGLALATPDRARLLASMLALFVVVVGGATMVEYAAGRDLGIDDAFLRGTMRMSPQSAISLTLLGLAVLARRTAGWESLTQPLIVLPVLLCYLSVVGLLFEATVPVFPLATTMSLNTAAAILLVILALALSQPGSGFLARWQSKGPGGRVVRVLLPTFAILPPLLSVLRGAGQAAGAYDEGFGIALQATEMLAILATGILLQGRSLDRMAEERARQAERFRLALEASPSGMVMVDAAGRIVLANQETARLFGYTSEELIGQPVEVLVPLDLRARHVAHRTGFMHAPTARRMGESRDLTGIRKDGSAFPIEVGLTPVHGETEMLVVAGVIDITGRKLAEEEARVASARLQERLAELESFSYTVAHDLRAPLRAIQGYARFVTEDLGDQASPASRQMLGRLQDASLRMDHLTRDLLNYSQISRGTLTIGPVDLDAVVAHVLTNYQDIAAAGVQVRAPLGLVAGQESLLVQVVSNLLGNAVKFVPKDRAPRIEIRSEQRDAGMLRVIVEDNGVGIPLDQRERIFLCFERLDTREPGTGIGLSIVRKAIERLGGRVGVESEPGRGSRFWFELPEAARAR